MKVEKVTEETRSRETGVKNKPKIQGGIAYKSKGESESLKKILISLHYQEDIKHIN